MKKICVEESLTSIQKELEKQGYDVALMQEETDALSCDCCVISGFDENIMGMQNSVTKASVINASGRSVEEVIELVQNKLK